MSLPVKRPHEEVTAAVVGSVEGRGEQHQLQQQQQHAGEGSGMVMEAAGVVAAGVFGGGGTEESRPAKVARYGDREVEAGESVEVSNDAYGSVSKAGRDGGASGPVGDGSSGKEGQVQQVDVKLREFGDAGEGKSDREGRDPARMDVQMVESGGNDDDGHVVKESSVNEEFLGRVILKGDEQHGGSNSEVGQELVDVNCGEANSEASRKTSPQVGESKVVVKDVTTDVKREEPREKDKEKKDEKQNERKEEVLPLVQHQLHLDVKSEKDNERDEQDREKGEREKERMRERERSRDREKEAVRTEKRDKREKERDRDPHRRERSEREERDESPADKVVKEEGKVVKEEGKAVKVEDVDMDRKPVREVDERKFSSERARERDRNKDRDDDGEGEKRKKRGREQEKDRDFLDTEGVGGEKDKDAVHGNGVQQRKRMLRPRGPSNPSNRDSRSRFRPKDNEGTQGRPENSFINYRAGEGMPELVRLRKEYEFGVRNSSANGSGPTVEIRIAAEFATTANRQIRGSQLWGTDIYTDDSDIVAVLFHTGYYSPSATPPPNSIAELRATIRILESQNMYMSTLRNSLRSRAWGGESGCSYTVESCRIMKQGGGTVELEPCLSRAPLVAPTLAPAASERTVTTRAASSSAYRQQRFMQEVTIQYNLCNEPWAKYSMSIVADRGLKKSQFTSARLKNGEVLYVETHVHRYELAYDGERTTCNGATTATSSFPQGTSAAEKAKEKSGLPERALEASEKEANLHTHNGDKSHANHYPNNGQVGGHHSHVVMHHNGQPHELYRWSKCKRPLPLSSMKRKGLPLPEEFVEVLEEGLAWEEVQWSPTSVWVRGIEYILNRAQFFSPDEVV